MNSLELRNRIARFLEDEISLQDLEEWLVANIPELVRSPVSLDSDLVAAVELALAEFDDGIRDLEGVKDYLRNAVHENNTIIITYPETETQIATTAVNRTATSFISIIAYQPSAVILEEVYAVW